MHGHAGGDERGEQVGGVTILRQEHLGIRHLGGGAGLVLRPPLVDTEPVEGAAQGARIVAEQPPPPPQRDVAHIVGRAQPPVGEHDDAVRDTFDIGDVLRVRVRVSGDFWVVDLPGPGAVLEPAGRAAPAASARRSGRV